MEQCNFGFFLFFFFFGKMVRKFCELWEMILLLEWKGLEEWRDQVTKPFWGLVSRVKCFNEASVKQIKGTKALILKCNEKKKKRIRVVLWHRVHLSFPEVGSLTEWWSSLLKISPLTYHSAGLGLCHLECGMCTKLPIVNTWCWHAKKNRKEENLHSTDSLDHLRFSFQWH